MEMTIAQQLKITEFPFIIKDSKGNIIYREESDGYWRKLEYNSNGNQIYYETCGGYWIKSKYDSNGNLLYYESSTGFWEKHEFDANGNQIYYADYTGYIRDNRPKTEVQKAIDLLTKEGLLVDGKVLKL